MPKYEFFVSIKYTRQMVFEANTYDDAVDLACSTRDWETIQYGEPEFNCEYNGEVENA